MGDYSILAKRIKELRDKLGKTQREFAEMVGCTPPTLSSYENNSKNPSLDIVKSIAEKCNVSIDWLCGLSDKETNNDDNLTYSDIIQMLFSIEMHLDISLVDEEYEDFEMNYKTGYPDSIMRNFTVIKFNNRSANLFLQDWKKMKSLYDSGSIDGEVYSFWMEKTLIKFKDKMAIGEGWNEEISEEPFIN